MDHALEIALIEELQGLSDSGLFFLDDSMTQVDVTNYGPAHFAREQAMLARTARPVALSGDLAKPGDFITRDLAGLPVIVTRGIDGAAHVLINACRHRGARLVTQPQGCATRFTCPYHAWTYSNSGDLRAIPHAASGFPDLDKAANGLHRLPVYESAGLIWSAAHADVDVEAAAAPLQQDFIWAGLPDAVTVHSEEITIAANWKLLIEGGLEAYHFKVAHKNTIGPHFMDNLSSYARLGPHLRSVLPRTTLPHLTETEQDTWTLRDHANVLYTCIPLGQFLVLQDHIAWIDAEPLAHNSTRLRMNTLAPNGAGTAEHWAKNHAITKTTLMEDFTLNAAQQASIDSGAQTQMSFGRYEGALAAFNAQVAALLR
ncbi:MAG: aromatic ring-hydroxylating dioxygenase subunit alpha [Pseudomonadota bacterium]